MRRKNREVMDMEAIGNIVSRCKTCHLAMVDEGTPYVVPLSFGYDMENGALTLYFHSAKAGRKLDVLRRNPLVCFELCREGEPVFAKETPCNSGYYYESVIGTGLVTFVEDGKEKCGALARIMAQQAGMDVAFTEEQAGTVCVFRLTATEVTGKRKPRPAER